MKKKKRLFRYNVSELRGLLDKALGVDTSSDYAIDKALEDHSVAHNEWAIIAAEAQKLLHLSELDLKRITAEVIRDIRLEAIDNGKPLAMTYNVERELCPLDDKWLTAQRKVINLREYVDILGGVERRFQNRAWLLISIAKGRTESFEPSVRGRKRDKGGPIETEEYEF